MLIEREILIKGLSQKHWNNAEEMKYSRDLGLNTGIVLVKLIDYTDVEKELSLPSDYNLNQNYPNPFNPSTNIIYSILTNSEVIIKVYDVTGMEIATIENTERIAGTYFVSFNAKHLTSGVYYYKLTANNYSATKKFVLIK